MLFGTPFATAFVLDLKIVGHRGGRAQVKIIREPPNYRIREAPDAVGKGAGGD